LPAATVCRYIRQGSLRAWRRTPGGRLLVSGAEVRALLVPEAPPLRL
jgi:hypothetical protein